MSTNVNDELLSLYRKYWSDLRNVLDGIDTVANKVCYPMLIHAFPEYEQSEIKVFIIGQEPGGWGFNRLDAHYWGTSGWEKDPEQLIQQIIGIYRGFHLGEKYHSPFITASHAIYRLINPNSPKGGFIWSNLIRIDQKRKRPDKEIEENVCEAFPVLGQEIIITKPDAVIFFTGPYYDWRLKLTFKGSVFKSVDNYNIRTLARIEHNDLPYNTYRTYHPHYIYRSRNQLMLNIISALVRN